MISQVEAGKLILEEAEFDLGHELEGLVDMFSVQCIDQNVELVLDLSGKQEQSKNLCTKETSYWSRHMI